MYSSQWLQTVINAPLAEFHRRAVSLESLERVWENNKERWCVETKYDGIRCKLIRGDEGISLMTKNGIVINKQFPDLVHDQRIAQVPPRSVLDGELIATDFRSIQSALSGNGPYQDYYEYICFDTLWWDGMDMRSSNLNYRQQVLATQYQGELADSNVNTSPTYYANYVQNTLKGEGFVMKDFTQPYGSVWTKYKFSHTLTVTPFDPDIETGTIGMILNSPHDSDTSVLVGRVQIPDDDMYLYLTHDHRNVTMLIEVEAFGYDKKTGTLRHPVYKGIRYDVTHLTADIEQLDGLREY